MKSFLALLLCVLLPSVALASENSYKVVYDGGSLSDLKSGTNVKLLIDPAQIQLVRDSKHLVSIPPSSITEVSYGQDVHRRIGTAIGLAVISLGVGALMALSKSKKALCWFDLGQQRAEGEFAMQCDKNEYRGILAALEGVSGKKAVDSDAMTVKN